VLLTCSPLRLVGRRAPAVLVGSGRRRHSGLQARTGRYDSELVTHLPLNRVELPVTRCDLAVAPSSKSCHRGAGGSPGQRVPDPTSRKRVGLSDWKRVRRRAESEVGVKSRGGKATIDQYMTHSAPKNLQNNLNN